MQDLRKYSECEVVIWMPVVEKDFGQDRFFSEEPSETIRKGTFNKVPVMIGRTTDEFISPVPGKIDQYYINKLFYKILNATELLGSPLLKELNENFNDIAPHCFFYWQNVDKENSISEALRKVFLPLDKIDVRSFNGLNYLFGDGIIGYPVHKFVRLISNYTDIYYYKFSYIGRYGWSFPHDKPYGELKRSENKRRKNDNHQFKVSVMVMTYNTLFMIDH